MKLPTSHRTFVRAALAITLSVAARAGASGAQAPVTGDLPARRADAIVDLSTREGAALVGATWRWHDAAIVPATNRVPGRDLKASGAPVRTFDIEPRAGAMDFDDSAWPAFAPESLVARRGNGKLSFGWYRLSLTLPERIGAVDVRGATVAFEIVVDDYAEVWVDGKLPLTLGQSGGQLVRGWNAPNRVVIARDARPGQMVRLAVFAANGPLSALPENFIWVRSATLDVYRAGVPLVAHARVGDVERLDPRIDEIIARDAPIERVATGFGFTEGPVWHPDGYLLFSDPNENTIYRWSPDDQLSVFRVKSGYAGADIARYFQPGSNGLTIDGDGRLTIAEHGRRRVTRIERNGSVTVLADHYEGKRLNSPNDLVYKSDGSLWFTDPPFGLPGAYGDRAKELPFSGVFRVARDGGLSLVAKELKGPNGIAFSPDERWLYVSDWDDAHKVITRYAVLPDGTLGASARFADFADVKGDEALDGLKVDMRGNVYVSAPGGLWILAPDGTRLGRLRAPELPANFAFGDADGRTLYMTARTSIYRIRLEVPGIRPAPVAPMRAATVEAHR